jgi:DNA-binding NarL/FixJ family response regulator
VCPYFAAMRERVDSAKIAVAIADDHQLVGEGLRNIIESVSGFDFKGHVLNGAQALRLVGMVRVDVLLLDLDMPEMTGTEALPLLKKINPDLKILVLTMHDEKAMVKRALELGADGYLLKNASAAELTEAIRKVSAGHRALSPEVTNVLLSPDRKNEASGELAKLSEREIDILKHIAAGKSNKEIGDELFISHRTVDTHRTNIMKKLDLHNIAGIIRFAIRHGLVD